jgi:hypothetical protein
MRHVFINLDARDPRDGLVASFTSPAAPNQHAFFREDDMALRLHLMRENFDDATAAESPFYYITEDPTTFSAVVAVGELDAQPTAGTFTITDPAGAQTSSAIAFDAAAATVQTALRATLTTNYSTCLVTGDAGAWTITRGSNGAIATLTASAAALQPVNSSILIANPQDGTASLPEQFFVELVRALPIAADSGFTALPAAAVTPTVAQAGSGTLNKVFDVLWNADAYAGDVTLTFTGDTTAAAVGPIAYNATAEEVVSAFEEHVDVEDAGVGVRKISPGHYVITCTGTGIKLSNTPALAALSNTLQVPVALDCRLSANTAGIHALLGGETEVQAKLEITVDEGGGVEISAHADCTVHANLIRIAQNVAAALGTNIRSGSEAIASGADYVDVVFATPHTAAWSPISIYLTNSVDVTPDILFPGTIVPDGNDGFRCYLSAATATANFVLKYRTAQ